MALLVWPEFSLSLAFYILTKFLCVRARVSRVREVCAFMGWSKGAM